MLDDYNIWDFDNGNGIYDVVTPADVERWQAEEEQRLQEEPEPRDDVPY